MKRISNIFILAGLLVLAYPSLNYLYGWYWEKELLKEFDHEISYSSSYDLNESDDNIVESYEELNFIFSSTSENDEYELNLEDLTDQDLQVEETDATVLSGSQNNKQDRVSDKKLLIGTIEIEKINLRLPLLEGASQSNLNKGAGHLTGTSRIGEIGNAAIAAHRSFTYGRFFNRLDELDINDHITVKTGEGTYIYRVYKVHVVEPTDLTVLNRNQTHSILTLITCDPIEEATHRLIIHAVKVD